MSWRCPWLELDVDSSALFLRDYNGDTFLPLELRKRCLDALIVHVVPTDLTNLRNFCKQLYWAIHFRTQ